MHSLIVLRREIILEEDHFEEEIFLEFETIEEFEEWFV
tara:strand:- start:162 stop:275 length:114 start_codon:yes stop_codon:yes gene_type:complete